MKLGKRIFSLLLASILLLSLPLGAAAQTIAEGEDLIGAVTEAPAVAAAAFAGGSGTEADPYLVETKYHLDNVRNDLTAHYKLIADIEFTDADFAQGGDFYNDGTGWQPIGISTASGYVFTGSFDGDGHTISGLQINITSDGAVDAALFGFVKGGKIKNLGMVGGSIYADSASDYVCAGGIVGYLFGNGTVTNCYHTGSITAQIANAHTAKIGGVVAESANATITDCYNTGVVTLTQTGSGKTSAGGVVGSAEVTAITDCHNTAAVTVTAKNAYAGGVAGCAGSGDAITGCYNTGAVSAKTTVEYSHAYAGGITGQYGMLANCYNAGTVLASAKEDNSSVYAGGIVGNAPASVTGCYNTAEVSAKYSGARSYSYAGGIAGQLSGGVTDCYNTGYVFSTYGNGGGIVGNAISNPVTNCYNTGRVVSSYCPGSIAGSATNLTNCYYLENINPAVGKGTATATSCTEEQLKQQATFVGFDFDTVWTMVGTKDYLYPELRNLTENGVTLKSIAVITLPTKNYYLQGLEDFDATGGEILLSYVGGASEIIAMTEDMVTGFDNTVAGNQILTVTYRDKTSTFPVTIRENNTREFAGGFGLEEYPYLVETKEHLNNVRNHCSAHYKMIADIEFTEADFAEGGDFYNDGTGWQPIGSSYSDYFSGTFDGDGHTVTGLQIYMTTASSGDAYVGLFGYASGSSGQIKNLGMVDCVIDVTSSGSVYAGGIVGYVKSYTGKYFTITNCYSTGAVTATSTASSVYAGGVVGYAVNGMVTNCGNTGAVIMATATSDSVYAGGIVGLAYDSIVDCCSNAATVTAITTSSGVGYGAAAGGIIGWISVDDSTTTAIQRCYNTGNIVASAVRIADAAGIAGAVYDAVSIQNCFNTGSVAASAKSLKYNGGIAGTVSGGGTIQSCYNTGTIGTGDFFDGGLVGMNTDGTLTDCYYLDTIEKGVGSGTDTAVSCTAAQMKQEATFAGFDFDTVWTTQGDENYLLPRLQGLPMEELHRYTDYTPDGNATCTADGTKTALCDYCHKTDTVEDVGSAPGHNYEDRICTNCKEPVSRISGASLTLSSPLRLNVSLELNGCAAEDYTLRATLGQDAQYQTFTYGSGAQLPAHRLYEPVKLELVYNDRVIHTETWTMESYAAYLRSSFPQNTKMMALLDALEDYGAWAAYYADPTGTVPSTPADAVTQGHLLACRKSVTTCITEDLKPSLGLYLDDSCCLRIKFDAAGWGERKLFVDGKEVTPTLAEGKMVWQIAGLRPQDWGSFYHIQVQEADGRVIFESKCCVLSYAYTVLGMEEELQPGLKGLLKAMYLYSQAAVDYQA